MSLSLCFSEKKVISKLQQVAQWIPVPGICDVTQNIFCFLLQKWNRPYDGIHSCYDECYDT